MTERHHILSGQADALSDPDFDADGFADGYGGTDLDGDGLVDSNSNTYLDDDAYYTQAEQAQGYSASDSSLIEPASYAGSSSLIS